MHEGVKGKGAWPLLDEQLTMETKKTCDLEYQKRAIKFMEKSVKADKPFYCYFNHSLMHFPMSPRDEFVGKSTNGDWGDCLLMLDHDFGVLLDKLDELGVADNTIVVMCGDNGAEDHLAGRGTGGFFDGSYFSSAEGGIRTPLLIRWPDRIPAGLESNEMVHVTDMFTTLLSFAGCEPPADRLIDGVDQTPFFLGKQETSNRESCIVWLKDELHAVKWKDFKINFKRQQHFHDPELALGFARITHLKEDPKERDAVNQRYVRWWVMQHAHRIIRDFEESAKKEELFHPAPRSISCRSNTPRPECDDCTDESGNVCALLPTAIAGGRAAALSPAKAASGHAPDASAGIHHLNSGRDLSDGLQQLLSGRTPGSSGHCRGFLDGHLSRDQRRISAFVEATGYITYSNGRPILRCIRTRSGVARSGLAGLRQARSPGRPAQ